uniref:hypothetical protein n=1 Tax=Ornithobacterium rhinotracheale TaxID=28251 RepID=UPI0039A40B52
MKKLIFLSFCLGFIVACSPKGNQLFKGDSVWQRDFYPMPGLKHHVEYQLGNDSISYAINGSAVNTAYTMRVDTVVPEENRMVVFDKDFVCYVLFIKELGGDSIKIFKEQRNDRADALNFPIPALDYKANHNQGWNTYYKKS